MTIEDEEKLSLLKEKLDILEDLEKSKKESMTWKEKFINFFSINPELQKARSDYSNYNCYLSFVKSEREKKEIRAKQFNQYEYFRDYIQNLPEYTTWKNAVFAKNGKRCEKCGDTQKLEIHHVQSFHSIVRAYQTGKINKKKTEILLWNIDNGQVLCKGCHSKIDSSVYRAQYNRR